MHEAIRRRGIHLDLKGAPLPYDVLLAEIDQMAAWGINLLLVEYEDTFPYAFDPGIQAPTAYTREQIAGLLSTCKQLHVEVIPLVQTFGHLEFVLKYDRYAGLAQTAGSIQSVCPCTPEARALVLRMVDELLDAHPGCGYIHLGGDEVWDLGQGERSKARADQIGKDQLYLEQMLPIIESVSRRGVRPILWDDMMRKWPQPSLQNLAAQADLMAWSYGPTPIQAIGEPALASFQEAGVKLWAAGAFKGANGPTADLPNDHVRAANMDAWARYACRHNFEGMVATGWSRYSGLTTYCELWWAAPMSLCLAGHIMTKGRFDEADWPVACREAIGAENLPMDWSLGRTPERALDHVAGRAGNVRRERLRAAAALAQWRRGCEALSADRWLGLGHWEDRSRYNRYTAEKLYKAAQELDFAWAPLNDQFTQAMAGALHERDIQDYLASRRRIGMQYLKPVLDEAF